MRRLLLVAVLLCAACDRTRGMENRTFELHRLSNDDAVALVTPYVREGGMVSGENRLITVREKKDRLDAIAALLAKYDGNENAVDVLLDVQIVEANGFEARDTAIADIEATLRETFRYRGYRLAGEARIQAREGSQFRRSLGRYALEGRVDRLSTSRNEQRIPLDIQLRGPGEGGMVEIAGTVTGTIGKPTVVGQSTGKGAVILVIRPSVVR